ncbi:hypothetical protein N7490_007464 [Penicillium lividum]|nr:hypothetical protein N7490_007464 [Penicillium lividum]
MLVFTLLISIFGAAHLATSEKLSYVAEPSDLYVAPNPANITTLLDFIDSQDNLSNLSVILRQPAGFIKAFDTAPTWSFTFFAPSNEAFEHTGAYYSSFASTPKGKWWLGNLINHHYVPNTKLTTSNFNGSLSRVQTASYLYINTLKDDSGDVKINSVATITGPDNAVTSGVVHIIDRILDPSSQIFESDLPKITQTFIAGSCSSPNLAYC